MSYKAVTHPRTKCFKKKSQQSKTTSTQPGQGLGKEIGPVQNEFSCCWFSHSTGQGQSSPSGAGPTHDPNEVMMRRDKDREAGWLWVVWNSSRCHSFGCSATALGWGCDAAQAELCLSPAVPCPGCPVLSEHALPPPRSTTPQWGGRILQGSPLGGGWTSLFFKATQSYKLWMTEKTPHHWLVQRLEWNYTKM